ncbi:MAG: DUF86 domain-containing protein [Burkholderiales bacterium]|nr:DUF86 domain-containing protein [Burkholderiales bacterium]
MDRLVLERKLESLRRCLVRVRSRCPATLPELVQDLDAQDVLVLNLSRAVQLCVDMAAHLLTELELPPPSTMGEAFTRLAEAQVIDAALAQAMRRAVGFRNLAVHNYDAIDWAIVFAIATNHIGDFERFARKVAERLAE